MSPIESLFLPRVAIAAPVQRRILAGRPQRRLLGKVTLPDEVMAPPILVHPARDEWRRHHGVAVPTAGDANGPLHTPAQGRDVKADQRSKARENDSCPDRVDGELDQLSRLDGRTVATAFRQLRPSSA